MSESRMPGESGTAHGRDAGPVKNKRSWLSVYLAVIANTAVTILVLYLIARFYSG